MSTLVTMGDSGSGLRELRATTRLALPLCLIHLGHQVMGIVDATMLGRYSDAALAGAGVGSSSLLVLQFVGVGIVMGLDTLIPQAIGAQSSGRAYQLLSEGRRLALLMGIPLSVLGCGIPIVLQLVDVDPEVIDEARPYIWGRVPSLIPVLLFAVQRSYLQARELTRPLVIIMIVSNVTNLILNHVLIFGDTGLSRFGLQFGLPRLGSLGAAISTSVVSVVGVLVAGHVLRLVAPAKHRTRHDRNQMRAIVALGLPVALHLLSEVGIFTLTGVLAGRMGTLPAASHHVALTLSSFSFSAALGIGAALSVRVGRAIGAEETVRARRIGFGGIGLAGMVMASLGVLFFVAPRGLARLFTDDPELINAAEELIRIAGLFQIVDGIQAAAAGALRGAGDTRSTFVANLAGHYLLTLPVAVWLAYGLGMQARGLWWGLFAGLAAVAVMLTLRFSWLMRDEVIARY